MKTPRNTLCHTHFAPEPVRRAGAIIVVVVGDENRYPRPLSTPGVKTGRAGLKLARFHLHNPYRTGGRTRGRGIPITIPAHMRHSPSRQEVTA